MVNMYDCLSFGGFLVVVAIMLALDLGVFHKDDHVITFKESLMWFCIWVGVAVLFGGAIFLWGEYVHGIDSFERLAEINTLYSHGLTIDPALGLDANLAHYRGEVTMEYFSSYLIEKSLSVDNIFVMIMIFLSFGVDQKYYHRVLFWGILGAVVLRFIFIFVCSALVHKFEWVLAIFGVILVYTGLKMLLGKEEEEEEKIDPDTHPVVRFVSKYFSVLKGFKGHDFFVKQEGKWYVTPLFIVLLVIEFSDIIFAVDSIPAIFSVTKDPYIVFFSNIFAIMGLRSLFFMLNSVMDMFCWLKTGLGFLLSFIGAKLILETFTSIEIGTGVSLLVIVAILTISIGASLLFPKAETKE